MLDDLKYIHQRDGQDALGIAEKQWQQLEHNFEIPKIEGEFENIVYAGMGGSALAAALSISWPGHMIPFEICRNYQIPAYVSDKTLFIACSFSGNTEETLAALSEAEGKVATNSKSTAAQVRSFVYVQSSGNGTGSRWFN